MDRTASIETLVRRYAHGKLKDAQLRSLLAAALPPLSPRLWERIETERARSPRLAYALARYDALHFATHAVMDTNAPHASHIALADGALNVLDIAELKLNARLVTLSACSSAMGQGGSGDEWLGLARAFFYASARAVVASLWNVDDASTAELMKLFYRNLNAGQRIGEALRGAQLEMKRKGFSAHHWGAFVAMGDA